MEFVLGGINTYIVRQAHGRHLRSDLPRTVRDLIAMPAPGAFGSRQCLQIIGNTKSVTAWVIPSPTRTGSAVAPHSRERWAEESPFARTVPLISKGEVGK